MKQQDKSSHVSPGKLMRIRHAPDQPPWVLSLAGTHCVVIKHLGPADGVTSSPNIWEILVDGRITDVHALDLEVISETG